MSVSNTPLSSHPGFRTASVDHLSELVHTGFGAAISKVGQCHRAIDARGDCFDLPSTTLWACSYRAPVQLRFPGGDHLKVQFWRQGTGATRLGHKVIEVRQDQSCLFTGEADVDFGENYAQFAWRIPVATLQGKLSALVGSAIPQPLTFDPVLDLTTAPARCMSLVLDSLLGIIIEAGQGGAASFLRAEMESALLVSLLGAAQYNHRHLLDRGIPGAAPWQVRRAESFIEANWDQPITVEAIVEASGASARSLFRTFRQTRGYTPLQFARQVRLRHAKQMLEDPGSTANVTEVALRCGFSEPSRFSKEFHQAFGVLPSTLLRRRK